MAFGSDHLSSDDARRAMGEVRRISAQRDEANNGRSREYIELDPTTWELFNIILQRPHGYDRIVTTGVAVTQQGVNGLSVVEEVKRKMAVDLVQFSPDDISYLNKFDYTHLETARIDAIGTKHHRFDFQKTKAPPKLHPVLLFHDQALSTSKLLVTEETRLDIHKVMAAFDFHRDADSNLVLRRFYCEPFISHLGNLSPDSKVVTSNAQDLAIEVVADVLSRAHVSDVLPWHISPIMHDMRDSEFARARIRIALNSHSSES